MEGVIVEDREGKIVSVSDTIFSLLGLEGKDDFQLVSGSELFRFLQGKERGRWSYENLAVTVMPLGRQGEYQGRVITVRTLQEEDFDPLKSISESVFTSWSLGLRGGFSWEKEGRELLREALSILGLDRMAVFRFIDGTLQCVVECSQEKGIPRDIALQELPWLQEFLKAGSPLFFSTLEELPPEAWRERVFFKSHSIRSLALLPLLVGGSVWGVVFYATGKKEKEWPENLRRRLEFLSSLLGHIGETTELVESLRGEKEFLRLILEEIPDVVCFKDRESRFLWTSRFHLRAMGVSRMEEVAGKTDFDFFPPEQARAFFEDEQRIMETGEPLLRKLEQARFADGTLHWMLTSKIPVRNEKQEVVGILALSRDVTELKEAEERLSWERNLLLSIINTIPDHVYVKDRDHRFLLVNKADARHHGFASPEEMQGKTDFDLHPPELAWHYWEEEEKLLSTGKTVWNDERQVDDWSTGTKRKIWIATNKAPLLDEKGKIVGMVGVNRNITERKEMEEALRESEKEKVLILNALQDQVTYFDADLRIIWVNRAVFDHFGLSPSAIIGKRCYEVIAKRDTPCPGCAVARALQSGKPQEGEVVSYNGTVWHQKAYPILDAQGRVFRLVEISLNITERRRAEERIRYLSFHDSLTGLYNRFFFQEELQRLDTARQLPLSIIMGDVNNLKLVNDAFGHEAGDELLKKMASILLRACRKEDLVARWGGDEFLVLLPRTSLAVALEVVERVKKLCREESQRVGPSVPLSIALGCATKEREEENIQDIINKAESRMYRNKLLEGRSTRSAFLTSLERSLWEISEETEAHSRRMRDMALQMGSVLGLSPAELDVLELLARLHDLGKLGVSRSILAKPGLLSEKEWEEVKKHPEIGYRIAQASPELLPVAEGILTHHERFDGRGVSPGFERRGNSPFSPDHRHCGCFRRHGEWPTVPESPHS